MDENDSFAYGDTHGDFAMLKRVGNPVAINPARELLDSIKMNQCERIASNLSINSA